VRSDRAESSIYVTRVPTWGVVSSAAAPVLLVGGWTLAARLQPHGFDAVTGTISDLAARGASDRWVMTLALAGTGACQIATSLALSPARPAGRWLLACGGLCTLLVATNPLPAPHGHSAVHTAVAAGAFAALAVWPLASWRRSGAAPWGLRPRVAVSAGGGLVLLTGWFFSQALGDGARVGLVERVAAAAQTVWPCAVVLSAVVAGREVRRRADRVRRRRV